MKRTTCILDFCLTKCNLKRWELNLRSTCFAFWEHRAVNEVWSRSVHTQVNLIKLAVFGWINIAFNVWSIPNCILYSSFDAAQAVGSSIRLYSCTCKSLEEVGFLSQIESCFKIVMLTKHWFWASTMFLPFMGPKCYSIATWTC